MKATANAIAAESTVTATASVSMSSRRLALRAADQPTVAPEPPRLRIWKPVAGHGGHVPTSDEVLQRTRPPQRLPAEFELAIMDVLTRPLGPGETHQVGNDHRERELRQLFSGLTPVQAYDLRRRLELDRSDDELAVSFRRLVAERRQRLRAFLADPRRRARY